MRGSLMRLWSEEQHKAILEKHPSNVSAAAAYTKSRKGSVVGERNVRYWRKVFLERDGNLAAADRELKESRQFIQPQPDDDIGKNLQIPAVANSILVIPDQHAPYQHPDSMAFLREVAKQFRPSLVVNLGDELDYHAMSFHDSDPNLESAGTELERAKVFTRELLAEFPHMLVCHSNHGSMVYRRAKAHGIPVQMLRKYRDVVLPDCKNEGWSWAFSWRVQTPLGPVMFKHQSANILADAAHNNCNLVVGHNHGNFSVEYSASSAHLYYGAYAGCLIDKDAMAFAYGKHALRKPVVGCLVILNGRPVLVPMVLNTQGRWEGKL